MRSLSTAGKQGGKGLSPGGVPMLKSREGEKPAKYWEGPSSELEEK